MQIEKLESKDINIVMFGFPVMIALIVIGAVITGHVLTTRSDRPTNVVISPASPNIDVHVPQGAAPRVDVSAAAPKIDVNVPQAAPPTINVTPPPAVVTVVREWEKPPDKKAEVMPEPKPPKPAVLPPQPASAEKKTETRVIKDEELTLDTLYKYAEGYVDSYCRKNNVDGKAEAAKWNRQWQLNVQQAVVDGTDTSEQTYIDRIVVQKRNCFDIEKATPEQVVEGCRIMLRYRDGKLAWLKAMQDAVTNDNLKKTLVFLAAGVR